MALLPGKTIAHIFYIRTLSKRVLVPDALPTAILIRNGVDTVVAVSVTVLVDGSFLAQATLPNNWSSGDSVHLRLSALSQSMPLTETAFIGQVDSEIDLTPVALLVKVAGFKQGVTVSAKAPIDENTPGYRHTSDGVSQTWTLNSDGSETLTPDA